MRDRLVAGILMLSGLASGGGTWSDKEPVRLEMPPHTGSPEVLAFSPDGTTVAYGAGLLATGGEEAGPPRGGRILLFDAKSGELRGSLDEPESSVRWLVWSPDGKTLLSANKDATALALWDVRKMELRKRIEMGTKVLTRGDHLLLGMTPDASRVATILKTEPGARPRVHADPGELSVWDARKAKVAWAVPGSDFLRLAISPDGESLVGIVMELHDSESDGLKVQFRGLRCELRDMRTGGLLRELPGAGVELPLALFFGRGGEDLISFYKGGVRVRDLETGQDRSGPECQWSRDEDHAFQRFAYSPRRHAALRAVRKGSPGRGSVRLELLDLRKGRVAFRGDKQDVGPRFAFSPDLDRWVFEKADGTIVIGKPPWAR